MQAERGPASAGSTKRSGRMMCGAMPQQHLALGQRLAHQPERAVLEIAQAAVDQLGRGRRGAGGEVVLLEQQHAQAAAGGVARDAGAVDAAADDGEIVVGHGALRDSSQPCPAH